MEDDALECGASVCKGPEGKEARHVAISGV